MDQTLKFDLLGANVYKTLESCRHALLTRLHLNSNTSVTSNRGTFSPFSCLVIFFSLLPSNLVFSGMESSRQYPVLIRNLIRFSILLMYICIGGLSVSVSCFLMA